MTNVNAAQPVRFENGGVLTIDNGSSYTVIHLGPGTLRAKPGLKARKPVKDRGAFTGVVLEGDEQESTIEFTALATATTFDSTELAAVCRSTSSSGAITKVSIALDIPDYRGGGGRRITYADCYMPEGDQYQAAGEGADPDTVSFMFKSLDPTPTEADYT